MNDIENLGPLGNFIVKLFSYIFLVLFLYGTAIAIWLFAITSYKMATTILEYISNLFI